MAPATAQGMNGNPKQDFDSRFRLLADQLGITERVFARLKTAQTEAHAVHYEHGESVPLKLDERRLRQLWAQHQATSPLILIVNNIDFSWLTTLGSLCNVDERVFLTHLWNATNESEEPLHMPPTGSAQMSRDKLPYTNRFWMRRCVGGAQQEESALCLSFAMMTPNITLVLTDETAWRTCHWFSPGSHPVLFDAVDSEQHGIAIVRELLFENEAGSRLNSILQRDRQMKFQSRRIGAWLDEVDLLRWDLMLAAWNRNLAHLGDETQELALEAVNRPTSDTLRRLNYCRSASLRLHNDIARQHREVVSRVENRGNNVPAGVRAIDAQTVANRTGAHSDALTRSEVLNNELKDAFETLIAAISILDSEVNKDQARRSTMLTLLAAIYLPLSLGTSAFGMNIKQLDGDVVPEWWVPVLFVGILLVPSGLFIGWHWSKERCKSFLKRSCSLPRPRPHERRSTVTTKQIDDTSSQYSLDSLESGLHKARRF